MYLMKHGLFTLGAYCVRSFSTLWSIKSNIEKIKSSMNHSNSLKAKTTSRVRNPDMEKVKKKKKWAIWVEDKNQKSAVLSSVE